MLEHNSYRSSGAVQPIGGIPELLIEDTEPWLALYVKPRHEKKVAIVLRGKGYEPYLPLFSHQSAGGKTAELPVFPGYVFCRISPCRLLPVIVTPGVLSIVGNGTEPLSIPEDEIQRVRAFVESGLRTHSWPYVAPGQEVTVLSGPLRGLSGVFVEAANQRWLVVSITLLNRSIAVKLDWDVVGVDSRRKHIGETRGKSEYGGSAPINAH